MISGIFQACCIAVLLMGSLLQLAAGDFSLPADGPVPFRRDKLPLDVDGMATLSRQVESLARGLNAETAADRRGAAQMLALALALDPDNVRARQLLLSYFRGRHQPESDADRLERSRARIWQNIAWLESPAAGGDGHALAACLKDVMVISDPKHPNSATLKQAGEKGAWTGWVPALASYETGKTAASDIPAVEPVKTPEVVPVAGHNPALEAAGIRTVLWQKVGQGDSEKWSLAPALLEMTASYQKPGSEGQQVAFALSIGPGGGPDPFADITRTITRLLKSRHENLPAGLAIHIAGKPLEETIESKRRQYISAPCAVLASAAITGNEPDAMVIGQVSETGAFTMTPAFWSHLRALGKGGGNRLILPAEAASVLPSVLALENPGFFMEYEVLLADDFKQLLELSAKTPGEPLASASAKFREVRGRMGNQDVRLYLGNSFVKQRLMAVLQEAPFHFSAKALLIQASGNRPTLVARPVLAAELKEALEPMSWLVTMQDHEISSSSIAKLNPLYDLCRAKVDGFERYVEKNDQALFVKARETLDGLRGVERASRARGENWAVVSAISTARRELGRRYQAFVEMAAEATGEVVRRNGN